MATAFGDGERFDFKKQGGWTQDKEDFGNFFYGAVASTLNVSQPFTV
jgi:hypothetical protein